MQHQSQAEGHLPDNEKMARAIPLGHLGTPARDITVTQDVQFVMKDGRVYKAP